MCKIKRHKLLNLYYIHDQYSGPIQDEYEFVEQVNDFYASMMKLKEYQEKSTPNIEGIFEDYYKYEHMKSIWGNPEEIQPSI